MINFPTLAIGGLFFRGGLTVLLVHTRMAARGWG